MSKFPEPLITPEDISISRDNRNKEIIYAVKIGIFFRLSVIFFELFGVILINSSSLFLDAISSMADVITSLFLILCVKLAQRPPDINHPFGHGRYEPMGGLILGLLLVMIGGVMFFQQAVGVVYLEGHRHINPWAWVFSAFAVVILEIAYRLLIHTAKKSHSPALAVDAYHYRIDSLTSLAATIALIIAAIWPESSVFIDIAGAILIAIFMIILGLVAARENFHQLVDKIPDLKFFELVKEAALRTSGVEETEKIRIQNYGPDAHVDIDIEVNPFMTVDEAHKISQQVRFEIQKSWPAVRDVTVHIEPFYPNDH